jgi:hypothetical protein
MIQQRYSTNSKCIIVFLVFFFLCLKFLSFFDLHKKCRYFHPPFLCLSSLSIFSAIDIRPLFELCDTVAVDVAGNLFDDYKFVYDPTTVYKYANALFPVPSVLLDILCCAVFRCFRLPISALILPTFTLCSFFPHTS